jgi:hypothetical protein
VAIQNGHYNVLSPLSNPQNIHGHVWVYGVAIESLFIFSKKLSKFSMFSKEF